MDWLLKARDFGRAVHRTDRPVAFLLGAGCSISSGAPTTSKVHEAFEQATRGRAEGQDLRDFLQEISENEKQCILAPLFEDLTPYTGYRSLAALGRIRRVHVLNLNWDPMVQEACQKMGVPVQSFDLRDKTQWRSIEELPVDHGVLCVHVHGKLGQSCRYSVLETLTFTEGEEEFIRKNFWDEQLLISGASLQGDTDVAAFLSKIRGARTQDSLWFVGRHAGVRGDAADLPRLHALGANLRQYCVAPQVDFDRLMLAILEEVKGKTWDLLIRQSVGIKLPTESEMVSVRSELLRNQLDRPLLALVGEPLLGKTVLAHFLGHCFSLWSATPLAISHFDLPSATLSALVGIETGLDAGKVFILEDPFGSSNRIEENPEFLPQLTRLFASGGDHPPVRVIVTSRRQAWHKAVQQNHGLLGAILTLPESAADWYLREDLIPLAADNERVKALIEQGLLRKPGAIFCEMRRSGFVQIRGSNSADEIVEIVELLQQFSAVGVLCSLVRLQDFCEHAFACDDLIEWAGISDLPPIATTFLIRIDFEGVMRFKLDHPTTLEAVDRFLELNWDEISGKVRRALYPQHSMIRALSAWKMLRKGAVSIDVTIAGSVELSRWGAIYFSYHPRLARLNEVLEHVPDQWMLTELAYEVVRVWESVPAEERRTVLKRFINDRTNLGTYAIFEASLYHQRATHPEILAGVADEAWDMIRKTNDSWEIALMFDALMWRPLPDRKLPEWAREYIDGLHEDQPNWGMMRFLEAYHPEGFALLPARLSERDKGIVWTKEQAEFAVRLVQWHFVHQAYSRVLLGRLRILDKEFLCRTLHPPKADIPIKAIEWLIESIAAFKSLAGWAFLLGCNISCVQTRLDDTLIEYLHEILAAVSWPDIGAIAACLTYDSVQHFQPELRRVFREPQNRDALLDILRNGLPIGGTQVVPPRFVFARHAAKLFRELDIRWPNLTRFNIATSNPPLLARELWERAQPAIRSEQVSEAEINTITNSIERGDLRLLEQYAKAARGDEPVLQHILDTYLAEKREMPLFRHPP